MPDVPANTNDIKDIRVAGCRVKLSFRSMEHGKWIVQGILQLLCGDTGGVSGLRTEGNQEFSLAQQTGEPGSTIPKTEPPYYPNTAGNIVAPPGNPAGNPAGALPITGGTENQSGGWPAGRSFRIDCLIYEDISGRRAPCADFSAGAKIRASES
ncbi:MAG: hypothetical protein H8K03_15045 [Nitrospira sp.]